MRATDRTGLAPLGWPGEIVVGVASTLAAGIFALGVAGLSGCGDEGLPSKVVYGEVRCGDETADTGSVRFVPIEGTPGPASTAQIVDGAYRIDARGGVPLGKHRVEVQALKETGEKAMQQGPTEPMMRAVTVPLGPARYRGERSPLIVEVTSESDGQVDIELPKE